MALHAGRQSLTERHKPCALRQDAAEDVEEAKQAVEASAARAAEAAAASAALGQRESVSMDAVERLAQAEASAAAAATDAAEQVCGHMHTHPGAGACLC